MIGYMATMHAPSTIPATRREPTIYQAVGLLDDPFSRDLLAGPAVALASQQALLTEVRTWLKSTDADAAGLTVIAGAPGSGRSWLLSQVVAALDEDDRLIGIIPDEGARRSDAQLLKSAIAALGGTPAGRTGLELTTELRTLLDAHRDDELFPVLLIDNAAFTGSQLEIMRGVLGGTAASDDPTHAQIILFGPAELPDRVARRRSLTGLTRHVTRIPPLEVTETATLLNARVAAMRDPDRTQVDPFLTAEAIQVIHEAGAGLPGRILALAHAALREAIATGGRQVDLRVATAVTSEDANQEDTTETESSAIQTRLALPGFDEGAESQSVTRRRGRQR